MTTSQRVEATRAYLSIAALVGVTLVFVALANLHPVYGNVIAAIAVVALLWWWRSVFSARRVLLWLEERVPELRYSLAALVDVPETHFRPALERRVREAKFGHALARAGLRLVGLPLAMLLTSQLVVRPLISRAASSASRSDADGPSRVDAILGNSRFAAVVTPPAYASIAPDRVENPTTIAALVGSQLRFEGRWTGQAVMPRSPTVLRLQRGTTQRLVALAPRPDSMPRVVLDLPARDSVLAVATGTVRLVANVRDDIGLVRGWFETIISSGTGESFVFRSNVLGQKAANGARDLRLETILPLQTLNLKPGDVVHIRAVARDANPASDAEAGSSETRTLRVFRAGDADSVVIEAMLPPEVGKSEVSQRMLIILTEALAKQVRTLARPKMLTEAQKIAEDQSRLRKRVGQIIFTRLSGEEDEHEADEALADTVSPAEALLRAASAATGAEIGEEHLHEDSPIVAVNRPLLEAFNAMWDAERRLGIGEPREALPFMRAALAAIQRARAAERIYLRGRPPKIVLDIPRIRLTGKREGIDPVGRAPRPSAITTVLARQARFHSALALSRSEPAAAVDSLILLRVDVLSADPGLAAALEAAIDDLRSGRDALPSLRAARRALVGAPATSARDARWSAPW